MLDIEGVNQEIVKYVEKKDIEKRIWIMQQQLELEKALPKKTNLRTLGSPLKTLVF